jgi:hypothetical protein
MRLGPHRFAHERRRSDMRARLIPVPSSGVLCCSPAGRISPKPSSTNLAQRSKRVHRSDRRSLAGASLAEKTDEPQDGESRLKAGCSQDWPPHKARGFLGSNLRRRASSFIGRGNLDRRSRRHTRPPLTGREACPTLQSTPEKVIPQNQRVAMSFQRL